MWPNGENLRTWRVGNASRKDRSNLLRNKDLGRYVCCDLETKIEISNMKYLRSPEHLPLEAMMEVFFICKNVFWPPETDTSKQLLKMSRYATLRFCMKFIIQGRYPKVTIRSSQASSESVGLTAPDQTVHPTLIGATRCLCSMTIST